MMQIWKFPIDITDEQTISIPKGSKILSAQLQNGHVCLWALVDPEEKRVSRRVFVVGTGNDIPAAFAYPFIGTVQMLNGSLAWHVFAELK